MIISLCYLIIQVVLIIGRLKVERCQNMLRGLQLTLTHLITLTFQEVKKYTQVEQYMIMIQRVLSTQIQISLNFLKKLVGNGEVIGSIQKTISIFHFLEGNFLIISFFIPSKNLIKKNNRYRYIINLKIFQLSIFFL